jgi:DNA-directed RNA polymerase subunit RPC12/RpoP
MSETCDVCWAMIESDLKPLHMLWHQRHAKDDVPITYYCTTCWAQVNKTMEMAHEEWHTYLEGICSR